jgi:mannose-6-phosphate isomerase-like protein (cupin superfamily)
MSLSKVNIAEKFGLFDDHWNPRIAAEFNDTQVLLVRPQGEFTWHHHDDADELFLVVRGTLRIELRDGVVELEPGELVVIPRGVEHRPVAQGECWVVLFEQQGMVNTGNVVEERTRAEYGWI